MKEFLDQLNPVQREAVEYIDGPSLIIAGAGSGKTRVLTYKIAYLLSEGVPPQSILALTFTNKAAREMKERIGKLVDPDAVRRLWMGTFHSIFARILRYEAKHLGYPSDFTIYDSADSTSLIKSIIKAMKLDDKRYRPAMVQSRISSAKNALVTYEDYAMDPELVERDNNGEVPFLRDIYKSYQLRCFQAGAMDFDDLLLQTNILFRDHPEVLTKYRGFFRYMLVDEYQDTNSAQHRIVRRLSEGHSRVCVVGDDAQSIYSFRGANIDNILQFKSQYPGCRVFKLERNYRSTRTIVDAANSLISNNEIQLEKTIYSEKEVGNKLELLALQTDYEEAFAVAEKIAELRGKNRSYRFSDFAVLYRTNMQSRVFEEALRKRAIPYRIYGGLSFYQRKEIKDILAYFRLVVNPHDEEALKRVINYPIRGIGDTTWSKIVNAAVDYNVSSWTVLSAPAEYALAVNAGTASKLKGFKELILSFQEQNKTQPAEEVVDLIMKQSGLIVVLTNDDSVEGKNKLENAQELVRGVFDYCKVKREEGAESVRLSDFLSEVALLTDQDNTENESADRVTLMTVHASKGLEFKNVFVVGLEEGLFPSVRSGGDLRAMEEERRLLYVAITRAEENGILTYAKKRFKNGENINCTPSRFLRDIDPAYLNQSVSDHPTTLWKSTFSGDEVKKDNTSRKEPTTAFSAESVSAIGNLAVGTRVSHSRFGEGWIIALEGRGDNAKATVRFDDSDVKRLFLKYAKLTVF